MTRFQEAVNRWLNAWRETYARMRAFDAELAERAFIADGGDVEEILAIEKQLGVTWPSR